MATAPNELLTDLLKDVSRSFYLTLRVLPKSIRSQIGLAYLLARTTDTIADTEIVPVAQRLQALDALRDRILGTSLTALNFGDLARNQGLPAERRLLENSEATLGLLHAQAAVDQKLIRQVLSTITSGQELDLRRFAKSSSNLIVALQTDAELDDYTYRVAGCVGEFWTAMCLEHPFSGLDELARVHLASPRFEQLSVGFGKGLQLVNILRDIPNDLRKGRCYLPADELASVGLTPADLLNPGNESKLRPVYQDHLDLAESHLAAGWEYTNLIPFDQKRLRLACAWPILIGFKTIDRLRAANVLDPRQRVKISRGEVWQIVVRSLFCSPFRGAWKGLAKSRNPVA